MGYRYMCSACRGTFDVAEQTFPPACPLPAHKRGRMELTGGASVLLTPPTGCQDANAEERERADFLNRTFLLPHFVPATGRGNINCTYRPRHGVMTVDLHVHLDFQTSSGFSWWSASEAAAYKSNCLKAIDENWNGRASIVCIKPRWEEIPPVRLAFGITFVESAPMANYKIAIMKDEAPYSMNGLGEKTLKCSAYIGMQQVLTKNPSAQITGQLQSFQVRTLNLLAAAKSIGQHERERLEKAIKDTNAASIAFAKNADVPTAEGKLAVVNFAWKAKQGVLSNTPRVPIKVVGSAAADETNADALAKARAAAIVKLLSDLRVPHPCQVVPVVTTAPTTAGKVGLSIDRAFEDDLLNYDAANYNIFAHEFGHMLGLPDEYLDEAGDARSNPKTVMQTGLVDLATKARVNAPRFGKATTSIMSYGQEVMQCHFLTLWEALGAMTKNFVTSDNWKIRLTGGS